MTILFERLKSISQKYDISFYAIEKGARLSDSSLRKWEESMPSWDKIQRVANFLDISIDYLLGNCDNPDSHKNPIMLRDILSEINMVLCEHSDATEKAKNKIEGIKKSFELSLNKNSKNND